MRNYIKEIYNDKFKLALVLAVLAVAFVAITDIWAMNSGVLGTPEQYTNGDYPLGWWSLFFKINLIIISLIPLAYFFFYRRDKSEALAIFITSYGLWFAGLADILFFVFQGLNIPDKLPWLNHHFIIGTMSNLIGFPEVTKISLILTVAISSIILWFIVKFLKEKV